MKKVSRLIFGLASLAISTANFGQGYDYPSKRDILRALDRCQDVALAVEAMMDRYSGGGRGGERRRQPSHCEEMTYNQCKHSELCYWDDEYETCTEGHRSRRSRGVRFENDAPAYPIMARLQSDINHLGDTIQLAVDAPFGSPQYVDAIAESCSKGRKIVRDSRFAMEAADMPPVGTFESRQIRVEVRDEVQDMLDQDLFCF